ncbi:MAG: FAD-dependent oxidoreductase [Proteobacteria bacterium]|nr:MAG: FAD-dependent oxidoreductase [Pseudomonadota bacterium]
MTETAAPDAIPQRDSDDAPRRLTVDRDADVCVVGGGLAGLSVALEAARLGAEVVVLEAGRLGAAASGHTCGVVMPGFGVPPGDLVARIGRGAARDVWALSRAGVDRVRAIANAAGRPELAPVDGALEVSQAESGGDLARRLHIIGDEFGETVEGWSGARVHDVLTTRRYVHAVHYADAFSIDGAAYFSHLVRLAREAGVRIYEQTPVVGCDYAGIRKRIVTPQARLRADHLVLAGNVHLGAPFLRLAATLTPRWRHAGLSAPLGERLSEAIRFAGGVTDADGLDLYRVIGDRLLWAGPETAWAQNPRRAAAAIRRRIDAMFPGLGPVAIEKVFCGVNGHTVHGMPQIGALRQGLWVVGGFGSRGLATTAMAGLLIARGILAGDDRWRQFAPYELVWAGGRAGRVAAAVAGWWTQGAAALGGMLARWREEARLRDRRRAERLAAVSRRVREQAADAADRR